LVDKIYKVSNVHICCLRIFVKQYQLRLDFMLCVKKPNPCVIVMILKEIMKYLTIQRENVKRGHAATIIATNVQNGVPLHKHTPRDVSIHQSPHRQLSAVCQSRPHSDAATVGLSKVSKVIQNDLYLSFCYKFFRGSVSSKSSNSLFLKM